jgi:hypothetical protein
MSLQPLAERAAELDIIHFHIDWVHLPLMRQLRVPFLTTVHGRLDLAGLAVLVRGFPDARLLRFRRVSGLPYPRRIGVAQSITACHPICCIPVMNRKATLRSSGV